MTLLAWQRGGQAGGSPVLLLHPWGSTGPRAWEATGWVASLAREGCDVLVPDLPGHGDSADIGVPEGHEPAAWAAEALQMDLRRLHVDACTVVGHGDAGPVAGHLACQAPHLAGRLVLISCDDRTDVPGAQEAAAALRDPAARVWRTEAVDLLARARDPRHDRQALAVWLERRRWPAAPRLGALRTPVLVAVGATDPHRERVPRLAQMFFDARVVTAPGDEQEVIRSPELIAAVARFAAG